MYDKTFHPRTHHIEVRLANTFLARLAGLMFRARLRPEEGLLLSPCRSVHTSFMRFPIDVVFLDHDFQVVGVVEGLPPWRLAGGFAGTHHVLELGAGRVQSLAIRRGDYLCLPRGGCRD